MNSQHDHQPEHNHQAGAHVHDTTNLSGKKIFWVTILNLTITVAEVIGGLISGKLGAFIR